jgi:ribonuclease-3
MAVRLGPPPPPVAGGGCIGLLSSARPIGAADVGALLSRFLPPGQSDARDLSLYQRAMVHRSSVASYASRSKHGHANRGSKRAQKDEEGGSYERLEFLGDAVLGLVTASYLFDRYPDADEGFMTRMRTKLINGRMLADLCMRHTTLPEFVAVGHKDVDRHVLEDVFEAFLGAVFVDLGFDAARRWLVGFLEENVDFAELVSHQDCVKAVLNRHCMRNLGFLPHLQEVGEKDGETVVRLVTPAGAVVSTGAGPGRREAEEVAVRRALRYYSVPGHW